MGKKKEFKEKPKPILSIHLLVFCLIIFLPGCDFSQNKKIEPDSKERELWYVLSKENLLQVADSSHLRSGSLLPWTVQERITDISILNDKLCFSVNGYGILLCKSINKDPVIFTTLYNHDYFTYKTITTILPVNNEKLEISNENSKEYILCHLYFNSMAFPFKLDTNLFNNANLIKLIPDNNELLIEELYPILPEETPEWEIIRFLPATENKYHLEWKNSQKAYSEFRYSWYSVKEKTEIAENWEEFLEAYNFKPYTDEKNPASLKILCKKMINESSRDEAATTYHFLIKDKYTHLTSRYIKESSVPCTDESFEIVTVKMFEDGINFYALWKSGSLYVIPKGDTEVRKINIPALPDGFTFTNFIIHENTLLLTWEESEFLNVGTAGFLIYRNIFL